MTDRLTPIHGVTGSLRAGKSTLLNALLRRLELAETAVIVNEFGAVEISRPGNARRGDGGCRRSC